MEFVVCFYTLSFHICLVKVKFFTVFYHFYFLQVATGKENKPSADKIKYKATKSQTLPAQSSQDPLRKAFGVFNTVNVRGSTLKGKENAVRPSSSSASTQPRRNQNPLLTKTYTVVVSKPNVTAASTQKRPTSTRGQTSGKTSSNAAYTVGAKSNSKSSLSSNCATTQMADSRISMGPLVKTKTGLTPAVIQPRSTKSEMLHATARTTVYPASVVAKKVQSSRGSASVPQRSTREVSLHLRVGGKVQAQNKPKPLDKRAPPASKRPFSGGLRVTSTYVKCNAPTVKPEGKALTSKTTGQSANRSVKTTSGAAPQPSSRTNSSTSGSRLKQAAVVEPAGKVKTNKEALIKNKTSSAKTFAAQVPTKRAFAPVLSQTAPQPSRTISITGWAAGVKTPKVTVKVVPQTEGKTTTSAQEERL